MRRSGAPGTFTALERRLIIPAALLTVGDAQFYRLAQVMAEERRLDLRERVESALRQGASDRLHAVGTLSRSRVAAWPVVGRWLALEHDAMLAALAASGPWAEADDALAVAIMTAAPAIGAQWMEDPRLLPAGQPAVAPRGRRDWPDHLTAVIARAQFVHAGATEALGEWLADGGSDRVQRRLRHLVFGNDAARSAAFDAAEQSVLQRAGLHSPEVQRLCTVADLALGLGRCVRIAGHLGGPGTELLQPLREACHELVRQPGR